MVNRRHRTCFLDYSTPSQVGFKINLSTMWPYDFWKWPITTFLFSGHTALSEARTAFKSIYLAISPLFVHQSLHDLSDRVWPHVSRCTTMSVGRNRQESSLSLGASALTARPSRTTSNDTLLTLPQHSLAHCRPFLHTSLLLFKGKDSFIGRCMCVCAAQAPCDEVSLHLRNCWGTFRCSYDPQDIFKCHNMNMSTG